MASLPDFEVLREMSSKLVEFVKALIPEDFSPYDYYYTYKPADLTNLYPPFNSMYKMPLCLLYR